MGPCWDSWPLHEWFYWLLNTSITGTAVGLIVWAAGRWRRMPRRIAHGLWAVPALRLLLPFSFGSAFSLASLLPEGTVRSIPLFSRHVVMSNSLQFATGYNPIAYRDTRIALVLGVAGLIWCIGYLSLLTLVLLAHLSNRHDIQAAQPLEAGVCLSDRIAGPAVYGIFRPRILLPQRMARLDLTHILAHERAHIRRRDNLWRTIAVLIACLHWFNPFVWLMLRAFLRETELACDEHVISGLDEEGRRAYAHALVDAAEARLPLASPYGGGALRERVVRILSFRRLTLFSTLGFLALAAALAWALLANAT